MAEKRARNSNSKRYAKDRLEFHYVCAVCEKHYTARWPHSTTCSNKCRQAKFRAEKKGNGKSWNNVDIDYQRMATDIRNISKTSYDAIFELLQEYGAKVAERAIYAAWVAAEACISHDEGVQS